MTTNTQPKSFEVPSRPMTASEAINAFLLAAELKLADHGKEIR